MQSHRIALLVILMCWLFLPAVFSWWLSLPDLLLYTFSFWGGSILTMLIADLRREQP